MHIKLFLILSLFISSIAFAQPTQPTEEPNRTGQCRGSLCTGDLVGIESTSGQVGGAGHVASFYNDSAIAIRGFDNRIYTYYRNQISSPGESSHGITAGMQVAVRDSTMSSGSLVGEGTVIGVYLDGALSIRGLNNQFYTFSRYDTSISSGCIQHICVQDFVSIRSGGNGYVVGFFQDYSVALRGRDNRLYLYNFSDLY